jgi:hypothetical protein
MHCIGLVSHIEYQKDTTGMNHINVAAASLHDIHKIKHLKRKKILSVLQ